jgi:hypothetical protein
MRPFLTALLVGVGMLTAVAPSHAQTIVIGTNGVTNGPYGQYYVPNQGYPSYDYGRPAYQYPSPAYQYYLNYYGGGNRGWHYHPAQYHDGYWHRGHYHEGHWHPAYWHLNR